MPKRKIDGDTAPVAKKAKLAEQPAFSQDLHWQKVGESDNHTPLLIVLDGPGAAHSSTVAAFDIDGCIITTKSGRKFATDPSDWKFLFDCVPAKLKELHTKGTKVVFFTNQAGIEKKKTLVHELQTKFEDIINQLGIPVQVFIATGENHYRKPSAEMWRYMESTCNGGMKIDKEKSFFVGDAAGRKKNWAPGKPKDFSCGDRMFAANIGVQFYTPEEFFLGHAPVHFEWAAPNPAEFLKGINKESSSQLHSETQEVMVVVGRPASGKSTLRERFFAPKGYVAVNRDTLGTQSKCLKVTEDALAEGKSVIVDNTNPSKAVRKPYIDLAKKFGVPARCIYLCAPPELCDHLNYYRQIQTKGVRRRVPDVGVRVYQKDLQKPTTSEGFAEVKELGFVPQFDSTADEELFKQWSH